MRKLIYAGLFFLGTHLSIYCQIKEFQTTHEWAHSPVEDQGYSASCWAYATTSFLESEQTRIRGTYTPLSEMFFVYHTYFAKAFNFVQRKGKTAFEKGAMAHDVWNSLQEFGGLPASVYTGKPPGQSLNDHQQLYDSLHQHLNTYIHHPQKFPKGWREGFEQILNQYLGVPQKEFKWQGNTLNPCLFWQSLGLNLDHYITLSSFLHKPFYSNFVLDVPYNFSHGTVFNLPLDELMETLNRALTLGYTAILECDVTDPHFYYAKGQGIGLVPLGSPSVEEVLEKPIPEIQISPQDRQKAFESLETSQDHMMHIIGLAKAPSGKLFYKVKNSWGKDTSISGQQGYLYLSEAYVRRHLISLSLHQTALTPKTYGTTQNGYTKIH